MNSSQRRGIGITSPAAALKQRAGTGNHNEAKGLKSRLPLGRKRGKNSLISALAFLAKVLVLMDLYEVTAGILKYSLGSVFRFRRLLPENHTQVFQSLVFFCQDISGFF
jgi:hypothetical protein